MTTRSILLVVTLVALGLAGILTLERILIAALSTFLAIQLILSLLMISVTSDEERSYWIGFAIFGIGFYYLVGGLAHREFYSLPGTLTEYFLSPDGAYTNWNSSERLTRNTNYNYFLKDARYQDAVSTRVRYIGNCVFNALFAIAGGVIAKSLYKRSNTK